MKPKKRLAIGVDFGGTEIKMGLVEESGRLLDAFGFASCEADTRPKWFARVGEGIQRLAHGRRLCGIGIGVAGFTDFKRGLIHSMLHVPGWTNVSLARLARKQWGLPAYVDNDVNAMAIGECAYGAGRKYRNALLVTLGTGVGGAVVIDGALYRGAYSMAGEIGHMSIDWQGHRTPEGRGGLETYVGNRQISDYAVRAIRLGRHTAISRLVNNDLKAITPRIIAQAAAQGDKLAQEIFDFAADCLATAFASATYLLQPQVIVVGGGVAQSGTVLFKPLRMHLKERLSPYFAERIKVVPARLGQQAGMIGCAALVFGSKHRTKEMSSAKSHMLRIRY